MLFSQYLKRGEYKEVNPCIHHLSNSCKCETNFNESQTVS